MKRIMLLLLIPLFLLSGCSRKQQDADTPYRIAVITMMQGGEFWGALKKWSPKCKTGNRGGTGILCPDQ